MDEKEFDAINVIPFIDIMLVLLTIVLTTSSFIARGGLPVNLPRASSSQVENLGTRSIEIDSQGAVSFEARRIGLAELGLVLGRLSRETPLLIRADRDLELQLFVDVLDAVKGLGFRKVSLQTDPRR